jgi:hypothetical protein
MISVAISEFIVIYFARFVRIFRISVVAAYSTKMSVCLSVCMSVCLSVCIVYGYERYMNMQT